MSEEDEELEKLEKLKEEEDPDLIDDVDEVFSFLTSGDVEFEFRSKKTGSAFTYRIQPSNNGEILFVSIKIDDGDRWPFKYFGIIKFKEEGLPFSHGRQGKARIEEDHPGAMAFSFGWKVISEGLLHKDLEVRKVSK